MKTPQQELLEVQSYILNQLDDICDGVRMEIPCKKVKLDYYTYICIIYRGSKCTIYGHIYYFEKSRINVSCIYNPDGDDVYKNILDNIRCTSIVEAVNKLKKAVTGFQLIEV